MHACSVVVPAATGIQWDNGWQLASTHNSIVAHELRARQHQRAAPWVWHAVVPKAALQHRVGRWLHPRARTLDARAAEHQPAASDHVVFFPGDFSIKRCQRSVICVVAREATLRGGSLPADRHSAAASTATAAVAMRVMLRPELLRHRLCCAGAAGARRPAQRPCPVRFRRPWVVLPPGNMLPPVPTRALRIRAAPANCQSQPRPRARWPPWL